jgi:hypothetical protein
MNLSAGGDVKMTAAAAHYFTDMSSPQVVRNVSSVSKTIASVASTTTSPSTVRIVVVHNGDSATTDMQIVDFHNTGATFDTTASAGITSCHIMTLLHSSSHGD